MSFAELLVERLKEAGLLQKSFAERAGCSASLVTMVAQGQRTPPLDMMAKWCEVLSLTGKDRVHFMEEARLAHCPPEIAAQFRQMRAELMVHESGMAATEAKVSALLVENGRLRDELEALKQQ